MMRKRGASGRYAYSVSQASDKPTLGAYLRLLLPGFSGFFDAFRDITNIARLTTPFAPERVRSALAGLPGTERMASSDQFAIPPVRH